MIRKYHNHKPQNNPWHREEEPHNHHGHHEDNFSKATGSLFPIKMIAKLEWTKMNKTSLTLICLFIVCCCGVTLDPFCGGVISSFANHLTWEEIMTALLN